MKIWGVWSKGVGVQYSVMGELKQISILSLKSCQQLLGAWYVTLQIKLNEEESKHAWFVGAKWFWPSILASLLRLVKGTANLQTLTNLPLSLPNLLSF